MNAEIEEAFSCIKPICDIVMVCPTPENIAAFMSRLAGLKKEAVQELQQYILFPFITHLKTTEVGERPEALIKVVEAIRMVVERVTINSYEMCVKIQSALLTLVFDKKKTGMVANKPEELKLAVIEALTSLMLNIDNGVRTKLLQNQVPLLAQVVFVAVNIAKIDRLRKLRVSAISCLLVHTGFDKDGHIHPNVKCLAVDLLSNILPGVLAALQDVATCKDNPGHAVVVAALNATHRIICLTMDDKYLVHKDTVSVGDFAQMIRDKTDNNREVSEAKTTKDLPKRSPEWFKMAGDKLVIVIKSLVSCATHEHYKVRKEFAILCHGLITQCSRTMQPSTSLALAILISLSNDSHPEVSKYCNDAVNCHFQSETPMIDDLCDNLFATLNELPRILNNIDSSRKLSSLNLIHGYLRLLSTGRPQRLTLALSCLPRMRGLCDAILEAAACENAASFAQHATRDVTSPPPLNSPWLKLRNLDTPECTTRLKLICQLLGEAECAELILDWLLEHFRNTRDCESACVVNWMGSAPKSSDSLVKRILETYIEDDVWYSALELSPESQVTLDDTLDVTVYNPRAWDKDSVPGLYEGAVETRYTDISYAIPRMPPSTDPNCCNTLAEAQKNLVLSCLITEGIGIMALRLKEGFQTYLLKTLCLVLERVGSKYELLHLSGLKSINDIAKACNHTSVADLIKCNSDYFTSQITVKLKKSWDSQAALRILAVVMEYSDANVLDCLYGIVEDVLVQSCDKYHENNLQAYLQVFLTFIECITKWFPNETKTKKLEEISRNQELDVLKDVIDYVKNKDEAERLLTNDELQNESGKSAKEMFLEDQREKEENILDYDDRVTEEKPPLPQHIKVSITILKRCINFISSKVLEESILALQVLTKGLPILGPYEDELLPLVHQTWSPLVGRFEKQPVVLKRALELLVTMAELAKDFIRSRAVKDVLPQIFTHLQKSSHESYLKDVGSYYRTSQAFSLQVAGLTSMPSLVIDLGLEDERLEQAMTCVDCYLSNKQPKPLQTLAVSFFRQLLEHDYSATWHHLRKLCSNDDVIAAPDLPFLKLEPVIGTPYCASNKDYDCNVKLVFECK